MQYYSCDKKLWKIFVSYSFSITKTLKHYDYFVYIKTKIQQTSRRVIPAEEIPAEVLVIIMGDASY